MDRKNLLDRFTITTGWILWAGIYILWVGVFFAVLEAFSPMATWKPWTWNLGTWLLAISLTIIGVIGYTLLMLLLVYGVRMVIVKWGSKLQPATKREVKPDANKPN
jgi:hypothetical protein